MASVRKNAKAKAKIIKNAKEAINQIKILNLDSHDEVNKIKQKINEVKNIKSTDSENVSKIDNIELSIQEIKQEVTKTADFQSVNPSNIISSSVNLSSVNSPSINLPAVDSQLVDIPAPLIGEKSFIIKGVKNIIDNINKVGGYFSSIYNNFTAKGDNKIDYNKAFEVTDTLNDSFTTENIKLDDVKDYEPKPSSENADNEGFEAEGTSAIYKTNGSKAEDIKNDEFKLDTVINSEIKLSSGSSNTNDFNNANYEKYGEPGYKKTADYKPLDFNDTKVDESSVGEVSDYAFMPGYDTGELNNPTNADNSTDSGHGH